MADMNTTKLVEPALMNGSGFGALTKLKVLWKKEKPSVKQNCEPTSNEVARECFDAVELSLL